MADTEVKGYQRRTASGQVITVKAHERMNDDAIVAARADPTRPPIAARVGTFPGGRAIPGVFQAPPPLPKVSKVAEEALKQRQADEEARVQDEEDTKAAGATFTVDHIKKVFGNQQKSPKTEKVIKAAANIVLPDTVWLSDGP